LLTQEGVDADSYETFWRARCVTSNKPFDFSVDPDLDPIPGILTEFYQRGIWQFVNKKHVAGSSALVDSACF